MRFNNTSASCSMPRVLWCCYYYFCCYCCCLLSSFTCTSADTWNRVHEHRQIYVFDDARKEAYAVGTFVLTYTTILLNRWKMYTSIQKIYTKYLNASTLICNNISVFCGFFVHPVYQQIIANCDREMKRLDCISQICVRVCARVCVNMMYSMYGTVHTHFMKNFGEKILPHKSMGTKQ